jgi:hypothetical protein
VLLSAIGRSIADKMGFAYSDIRLSMVDETDVGLYPSLSEIDMDGEMVKCWISLCLVGQLKQINDQLFTLKS